MKIDLFGKYPRQKNIHPKYVQIYIIYIMYM